MRTNLLKWYEFKYVVPQYSEKREILKSYKEQYNCKTLVETGTFLGDTVERMRGVFDNVVSIELAEDLAERAQKRFEKYPNVRIIQVIVAKYRIY